jgi:hypothetical protein
VSGFTPDPGGPGNSPSNLVRTDGSALADAPPRVVITLSSERDRWRYRCPNGHTSWDRTNNHIWCHGCSRRPSQDPEHYKLVDNKTGEEIAWSAVEVRE